MFPLTAKTICFGGTPPVSPLLSTHCQLLLSVVGKINNNIIKPMTFFCLRKLNAVHRPKQMCFYSREFICCCSALLMSKFCDPMNCSTPGLSVPQQLPEFAQVHVHCINNTIQPSHPLSPSSPLGASLRSSARGKGQEEGGSTTQRRDRASGVPLDILEHLPPKTRVCLLYCFVLSPLTLLGAAPTTISLSLIKS